MSRVHVIVIFRSVVKVMAVFGYKFKEGKVLLLRKNIETLCAIFALLKFLTFCTSNYMDVRNMF